MDASLEEFVRYARSMSGEAEYVTVYRSADQDADSDAAGVRDFLTVKGLHPVIVNDHAIGVVPGSFEVRVPQFEAPQAEALLTSYDPDAPVIADPSPDLDTVPIASMMGATAELEALSIKSVLDDAGIESVLMGDSALPNLEFQVRVARADLAHAREVLREAQAAGPAAASEAERESEANPSGGRPV